MDVETLTKLLNHAEKRREEYYKLSMMLQSMVREYYLLTVDTPEPSEALKILLDETWDLLKGLPKRIDK